MEAAVSARSVKPWTSAARGLSRWWLDRSVLVKGLTVVAIPMLALVAVAAAGLALQLQERGERSDARAASQLASASRAVLGDGIDAETGVRGYAVSADPVFLTPYTAASTRIVDDVRQMRQRAAREHLQAGAEAVAATVTEQLARLSQVRAAVDGGARGPELVASLTEANALADRLRTQVASLADGPAKLAVQKRNAITRLEGVIETVQWAGLGLGLLAGGAGIALFTTGISRRVRVAANNAELLGRGQPLRAVTPAADELGELGGSLIRAKLLLDSRLDELASARDHALRATDAKTVFLSRTSHELRTPLNAILGFAQLLEISAVNPDDRDSAGHIVTAGRHLLALINDLIDTALIEAGELRLSVEPVSVHRLCLDITNLMGPLAAARGITIEHDFTGDRLAAYADDQRLRQILVNLASNAVKYNHHGGLITIGYRLGTGDTVELAVTDTGAGLTAENLERIFVPFERLEAEQHGIEGSGIGLPLALGLTEAMHGELVAASEIGVGSTFTVRLPRAPDIEPSQPERATDTASAGRLEPMTTEPLVVLSIEDNPANSTVLAQLFQGWPSARLHAASLGREGIELARRHRPDLILLDLHLPDLPGEEVLARLRAEPATAHIPVVVVSADATPSTARRLISRSAAAYLTKPLDLNEFRRTIDQLAATSAAARPR